MSGGRRFRFGGAGRFGEIGEARQPGRGRKRGELKPRRVKLGLRHRCKPCDRDGTEQTLGQHTRRAPSGGAPAPLAGQKTPRVCVLILTGCVGEIHASHLPGVMRRPHGDLLTQGELKRKHARFFARSEAGGRPGGGRKAPRGALSPRKAPPTDPTGRLGGSGPAVCGRGCACG